MNAASVFDVATLAHVCAGVVIRSGGSFDRVTTDSRDVRAGDAFFALRGDRVDGHDFVGAAFAAGAAGVVVERSLAPNVLAAAPANAFVVQVADVVAALSALAAAHRRVLRRIPVVAVTGSCGKTTTKDMLDWILRTRGAVVASEKSFNNHLGVPLTLLRLTEQTSAAVVEIGTNAPGEIATLTALAQPDIAVVTLVAASHLEGLGSLAGVASEKGELVAALPRDGRAILNGDDARVRAMAARTAAPAEFVTLHDADAAGWRVREITPQSAATTFVVECVADGARATVRLPRLGRHNVLDATLALAAAHALGVPLDVGAAALATLPPTPRRLQVHTSGGVTWLDDTYNMNPGSAAAALAALAEHPGTGRRIFVAGEMLELGADAQRLHDDVGRAAAAAGVDVLLAVGPGTSALAAGARSAERDVAVHTVADVDAALAWLRANVRAGDRVLLKASRRVRLERVVDGMLATASPTASPAVRAAD